MSVSPPRAFLAVCLAGGLVLTAGSAPAQESLPAQLVGSWRIVRALPTKNPGCWDAAGSLVGTILTYRPATMRWHGGEVPLHGVITRTLTAETFQKETASAWGTPLRLTDLDIQSARVVEVDLQHEDADITGSTTEVPGDSILLAGRNTIVVSACGSFFEATRVAQANGQPGPRPTAPGTLADNGSDSSVRLARPAGASVQKR